MPSTTSSRRWVRRWIPWPASSKQAISNQGPGYLTGVPAFFFYAFMGSYIMMLTSCPRGFALLIAIALTLPSLHARGAGLGAGDMESVCLVKTFKNGVGGMRLPVWRPYLLLKDGTAYANPKLAPDTLDLAQSRQGEADRWGTW